MALGISTFLAVWQCLQSLPLDKVQIIGGLTLKDLTGNWLATLGEMVGSQALKSANHYIRRFNGPGGILPDNDDLPAAERRALGTVLDAFYLELKDLITAQTSAEERQWIFLLRDIAKDFTNDTSSAQQAFTRLLVHLQHGLGTTPLSALLLHGQSDVATFLTAQVHTSCLEWLEAEVQSGATRPHTGPTLPAYPAEARRTAATPAVPPAILRQWFLTPTGFGYRGAKTGDFFRSLIRRPPVGRPWFQLTFLQLWTNCYFEQLKTTPRAFNQHLLETLASLKDAQFLNATSFEAAWQSIESAVSTSLGGINQQLANLLGLNREKFSGLTSQGEQTHALLTDLLTGQAEQNEAWQALDQKLQIILALLREEHSPPIDTFEDLARNTAPPTEFGHTDLLYRRRWLNLLYRDSEMQLLCDFLNGVTPYSIFTLVGEGGTGKSRLALELVFIAQEAGWRAGFLESGFKLETLDHCHQWRPTRSTLLVIDYASEHGSHLCKTLALLTENEASFPGHLRILLIDRPQSLSAQLNDTVLGRSISQDRSKEKIRQRLHSRQGQSTNIRNLPYQESSDAIHLKAIAQEHWEPFLQAVFASGQQPNQPLPGGWQEDVARITANGRPLMLIVLGFHYLRQNSDAVCRGNMDDLLQVVIEDEVQFRWLRLLKTTVNNEAKAKQLLPALEKVIAIVTLLRGLLIDQVRHIRIFLNIPTEDADCVFNSAFQLLGTRNKADGTQRLHHFEPDLLAEHFLLKGGHIPATSIWHEPTSAFSIEELLPLAVEMDPRGVITTLALVRQDYPESFEAVLHGLLSNLGDDSGITNTEGEELIYSEVTHPIREIWLLVINPFFDSWKKGKNSKLLDTLLNWANKSSNAWYASWVGALMASEGLNTRNLHKEYRLWDQHVLTPLAAMKTSPWSIPAASFTSDCAFNELNHYGSVGLWAEHERWSRMLSHLARQFPLQMEIQHRVVQGAVNTIHYYGQAQRWQDLERWGKRLIRIAALHRKRTEIQHELAMGAVNAVGAYGRANKLEDLERWMQCLMTVARQNLHSREIQGTLCKGTSGAISGYGNAHRWQLLEKWGQVLVITARKQSCHVESQHMLAQGAFNAFFCYGEAQLWKEMARWERRLLYVANQNPANLDIQFQLTQGAVNALSYYGRVQNAKAVEECGKRLIKVTNQHRDHIEYEMQLARGAVNAINYYCHSPDSGGLDQWKTHLLDVAERHLDNSTIEISLGLGSSILMDYYGRAKNWNELEYWGIRLNEVASKYSYRQDVQLALATCAANAVIYYSDRDKVALERWGASLVAASVLHPDYYYIQHQLAKGALSAVIAYGTNGDRKTMEVWGSRLIGVGEKQPSDLEIKFLVANGASRIFNALGQAQDFSAMERWGTSWRTLAITLPSHPQIQLKFIQDTLDAINRYRLVQEHAGQNRWLEVFVTTLPSLLICETNSETIRRLFQELDAIQPRDHNPALQLALDLLRKQYIDDKLNP